MSTHSCKAGGVRMYPLENSVDSAKPGDAIRECPACICDREALRAGTAAKGRRTAGSDSERLDCMRLVSGETWNSMESHKIQGEIKGVALGAWIQCELNPLVRFTSASGQPKGVWRVSLGSKPISAQAGRWMLTSCEGKQCMYAVICLSISKS